MRRFYSVLTLAVLCFSLIVPLTLAQSSDSWPMYHGDPTHSGYVNAVGPSNNQTLWTYTTDGWIMDSPAIVNGVVYFSWSDSGYNEGPNNNLVALNAKDGTKLWNFSAGGKIYTSPAVANGIVYFGSDDNAIYAVNASTGHGNLEVHH